MCRPLPLGRPQLPVPDARREWAARFFRSGARADRTYLKKKKFPDISSPSNLFSGQHFPLSQPCTAFRSERSKLRRWQGGERGEGSGATQEWDA